MSIVLSILAKMGMALVTESVIKKLVVLAAQEIVKRTETKSDDEVLQVIKDAWHA